MKPEFTSIVESEQLKVRQLAVKINITGSATPASKVVATNLPGVAFLRTEGLVALSDAVEDLSAVFATATDSTGVFGLLIDASKIVLSGIIDVLEVRTYVENAAATLAATSAVAGFLSAEGNIAINLDSSVTISGPGNVAGTVIVTYRIK